MQNAWLDEAQPGIKIAGRNINNLRCAGGTTLMAKSKGPLKFSHSVVPYSLWPHELWHTCLLCPSPTPGACSNSSCSLNWWCHPNISSSVVPFSSCLQSFPASVSFLMSKLFASGGWSIGVSASASVLLMRSQGWFPLGFTGLISLQSKELSRVFSNTTVQKHQLFNVQPSLWSSSHTVHDYWKNYSFDKTTFASKGTYLLFNPLSRFVIVFLSGSKHLLISWLQSPSTAILETRKIKSVTVSIFFPIYLPWSDGARCHVLSFLNVEL